ncbi:MAG TPA: type II secretion system protein [Solirubrobacterales bacterium]|nr:type II secretion system protein [Solirubrobacterales bacterium]
MARPCIRGAVPRLEREERGFTLIELLVVLIIIGILAAIAIAAFANQQNKAHDADAKTHARSAQTAMESFYLEKRTYAGVTTADLEEQQTALQDANGLAILVATGNEFEVETKSTSTEPVTYKVHRLPTGTIERTCAPQNTGGCKADGVW